MEGVVDDNPYWDAVAVCELLDEKRMVTLMSAFLFDATAVDDLREAQSQYCNVLKRLPTPAQAFARQLENWPCVA